MNSLEAAAASIYTWCCIALFLARSNESESYASFVYLGGPLAGVTGFLLSRLYQESIASAQLRDLTSLSAIEMWARSRLNRFAKAVIELSIDGGGDEDETRKAFQSVLRTAEEIEQREATRKEMVTRQRVEGLAAHAHAIAQ